MHLFEILLVVPFTNAIVEHLFSRMNRVKTDFCNRLSRPRLDTCLRAGGDRSTSIEDFNPDCVIECWWNEKRWCLQYIYIYIYIYISDITDIISKSVS